MELILILVTSFIISAFSLVGAFVLVFKEEKLKKIIMPLVAFSAGAMLAGATLHLLPEAIEKTEDTTKVFLLFIIGFSFFFLLEQFIHWHHCHRVPSEHKHPVTYLILISDAIHNFLDGLAVGSAFVIDVRLGFATAIAIAAHELPQELGDFGILIHGGWSKAKALLFNFLSGITMIIGGLIAWWLARDIEIIYLLPFAAGNFVYIAASDLIPEIKGSHCLKESFLHFAVFLAGIIFMYSLLLFE